jgi:hypothetical protein
MPTPECWQDIGRSFGHLSAQIDELHRMATRIETKVDVDHAALKEEIAGVGKRVASLETDRTRVTTIGAIVSTSLVGMGVIFADPIKAIAKNLFR